MAPSSVISTTLREGDHGSQIASCETLRRDQGWDGFSDFQGRLEVGGGKKRVFFSGSKGLLWKSRKKWRLFFWRKNLANSHTYIYIYIKFVYRLSFLLLNSQHFAFLGSLMIGVTKYTGESRSSGNITGKIPSKKGARVNLLSWKWKFGEIRQGFQGK